MNLLKKIKGLFVGFSEKEAHEIVNQYFDLDEFYNEVGILYTFSKKIGDTEECLTINDILALVYTSEKNKKHMIHISSCQKCGDYYKQITIDHSDPPKKNGIKEKREKIPDMNDDSENTTQKSPGSRSEDGSGFQNLLYAISSGKIPDTAKIDDKEKAAVSKVSR
jgi:hypothetical protein